MTVERGRKNAPLYLTDGSRATHVVVPIEEYEQMVMAQTAMEAQRISRDRNTRWIDYDLYVSEHAANGRNRGKKSR